VNTRSPNHLSARVQGDDFERRSRLICLVYEVLQSMETPANEATDSAMFSALSRAFSDKANGVAKLEADALEGGEVKSPPRHSKPPMRTSVH
jgi:hypothetical protein